MRPTHLCGGETRKIENKWCVCYGEAEFETQWCLGPGWYSGLYWPLKPLWWLCSRLPCKHCLGPWICWNRRLCSWLMLSAEIMWKPMTHAPADYKEQGSYFCSDIDDFRHIIEKEGHGRLLWKLLPWPPPSIKTSILKSVIRMLKSIFHNQWLLVDVEEGTAVLLQQ